MRKLEIIMANQEVREISQPGATWLLSGCDDDDAARLESSGNRPDEIEPEICARVGDATIVKVVHSNGLAQRVNIWRGPTSVHELFRLATSAGDVVIADHFRNALLRLPTGERAPSDDAIVDHFLFRTAPGHSTHCQRIVRLGHGERSSIDLTSGKSNTTIFHRLDVPPIRRGTSDYLDDLEAALNAVLSSLGGREEVATLFSGGVDSTLLQTYFGPKSTVLNLTTDAEEPDSIMETRYAESAAGLLGATLRRQEIRQSDFLRELELATESAAMPMYMSLLAVFHKAFRNGYSVFISGQNADALFGCAARYNRIASLFANPFLLECLELSAPIIARKDKARRNVWRERLEKLLPVARRLSMDPNSMFGFGARSETYTDFDAAEMIFGTEAISRRLEKRFEYLTERVALNAPHGNRFLRHLEIFSLLDVLCGGYVSQLRHLALANAKTVVFPYMSGDVVRSNLGIPVSDRYIRGLEGKYILKRLLKRRLPSYPIGQRKGTTALVNFPRYYKTGPLSRIWDHYDLPDFIPAGLRDRIVESPLNVTYGALSYAIWKRRVLENAELAPLPRERRFEWTC